MRHILFALVLAASVAPIAARAQFEPPSPEVMAKIQQARTDAKTAAFAALSADHRTKVQAIVDQVDGGSLQMADAVTQIDAILTPDEAKAVLDQRQKFAEAMRALLPGMGGGGPPGGSRPGGTGGTSGQRRAPDAGRALLMFSVDPSLLMGRPH